MDKQFFQSTSETFLWISLLITTLVYFSLSFFVVPWADDFFLRREVMDFGFFKMALHYYQNWNGRYLGYIFIVASSAFTHSIFTMIYWDRIVVMLNFILSITSLAVFIKVISFKQLSWLHAVKYSLLFNCMLCVGAPAIFYYFYWSETAVIFTLGASLMLLLFANLIYLSIQHPNGRKWPAFFLIVLLCGTNEIIVLITGLFLIIGILLFKIHAARINSLWLRVFCFFVFFALLGLLAPGNFMRIAYSSNIPTSGFFELISWKMLHYYKLNVSYYLSHWVYDALLMISSAYIFISVNPGSVSILKKIKIQHLCLSIFIWAFLIILPPFIPKYFIGNTLNRYWNLSYFLFLLGWFINLSIVKIILMNNGFNITLLGKTRVILSVLSAALLLTNMKFIDATNDLIYKANFMDSFFHERFRLIETNQSAIIKVSTFPANKIPQTIFDNSLELKGNTNCFSNCVYQRFFDKTVLIENKELSNLDCPPTACEWLTYIKFKKNIG